MKFITILVLMLAAASTDAAARRVFGTVTDSVTGQPLPFANVRASARGSKTTVANENGVFRLNLPPNGTFTVSYTGYGTKTLPSPLSDTVMTIKLVPASYDLDEVVVKPKKEKYSKRNNPAVEFVRKLRAESGRYDPARKMPWYSYDKYEKTLFGLNDFKADTTKGFMAGKGKFFINYVDTSTMTGKPILPLMLKEKRSVRLFSRPLGADKEVTTAYRSDGIDETLDQQNMQIILEDAVREVNIYGNDITFLQNRFVSPLASIGPDFYHYYLTDTVTVGNERCVELSFAPSNAQTMGFNGKIYVPVTDTTMFVKKVTMRVPKAVNMNYVDNIVLTQTYEKDSLGMRHKTLDDVAVELRIAPGTPSVYGRKTTEYRNFSYDKRNDLEPWYDKLGKYLELDEARNRDEGFWSTSRMVPLTEPESRMGSLTADMRKVPKFYWLQKFLSLMESGYVRTGNPSKVDLGPVNTLLSHNTVEGMRLRVGGMTMAPLNPHLFAKGYVAYGFKDRKVKWRAALEYSFAAKRRHGMEWPRHGFWAEAMYDTDMLGQHYLFTNSDNAFLSFKRKESILATYRRLMHGAYILELPNHFSVEAGFRHERQEATPWVPFDFSNGRSLRSFDQSAFTLSLRWAPGEKFIQGRSKRTPVNMDALILQLTHEYGPKGMAGAAFTLNRTEFSLQKRLWFSAFGYTDIILKGGKIWSKVWYPALMWPNANLSYTIQPESYALMDPMEFANDSYASLHLTYYGMGILFNRLPGIRKLKLREVFTFNALEGHLNKRNNPARDASLLKFPSHAIAAPMGRTPYMEIGAGLDNILTVLRVDYVWRLTYLDHPGIDRSGVRVSLHFSF